MTDAITKPYRAHIGGICPHLEIIHINAMKSSWSDNLSKKKSDTRGDFYFHGERLSDLTEQSLREAYAQTTPWAPFNRTLDLDNKVFDIAWASLQHWQKTPAKDAELSDIKVILRHEVLSDSSMFGDDIHVEKDLINDHAHTVRSVAASVHPTRILETFPFKGVDMFNMFRGKDIEDYFEQAALRPALYQFAHFDLYNHIHKGEKHTGARTFVSVDTTFLTPYEPDFGSFVYKYSDDRFSIKPA